MEEKKKKKNRNQIIKLRMIFKTKSMLVTNSFPIRLIYPMTRKIRYSVIGKIKKNKIK